MDVAAIDVVTVPEAVGQRMAAVPAKPQAAKLPMSATSRNTTSAKSHQKAV